MSLRPDDGSHLQQSDDVDEVLVILDEHDNYITITASAWAARCRMQEAEEQRRSREQQLHQQQPNKQQPPSASLRTAEVAAVDEAGAVVAQHNNTPPAAANEKENENGQAQQQADGTGGEAGFEGRSSKATAEGGVTDAQDDVEVEAGVTAMVEDDTMGMGCEPTGSFTLHCSDIAAHDTLHDGAEVYDEDEVEAALNAGSGHAVGNSGGGGMAVAYSDMDSITGGVVISSPPHGGAAPQIAVVDLDAVAPPPQQGQQQQQQQQPLSNTQQPNSDNNNNTSDNTASAAAAAAAAADHAQRVTALTNYINIAPGDINDDNIISDVIIITDDGARVNGDLTAGGAAAEVDAEDAADGVEDSSDNASHMLASLMLTYGVPPSTHLHPPSVGSRDQPALLMNMAACFEAFGVAVSQHGADGGAGASRGNPPKLVEASSGKKGGKKNVATGVNAGESGRAGADQSKEAAASSAEGEKEKKEKETNNSNRNNDNNNDNTEADNADYGRDMAINDEDGDDTQEVSRGGGAHAVHVSGFSLRGDNRNASAAANDNNNTNNNNNADNLPVIEIPSLAAVVPASYTDSVPVPQPTMVYSAGPDVPAAVYNAIPLLPMMLNMVRRRPELCMVCRRDQSFHEAIRRGDVECAAALVDQDAADINGFDTSGFRPLHLAAADGNIMIVHVLLNGGADYNAILSDGRTPLHYAAVGGYASICAVILSRGARVDAADNEHKTALHHGAEFGHDVTCAVLLKFGAHVDALDENRWCPLHYACVNDSEATVAALLSNGADVNLAEMRGTTPLHLAARLGGDAICQSLIARGAGVETCDILGKTPLHEAASWGHVSTVSLLLSAGADVNAATKKGVKALHFAARRGYHDVCEVLINAGAVDR